MIIGLDVVVGTDLTVVAVIVVGINLVVVIVVVGGIVVVDVVDCVVDVGFTVVDVAVVVKDVEAVVVAIFEVSKAIPGEMGAPTFGTPTLFVVAEVTPSFVVFVVLVEVVGTAVVLDAP